MGAMLHQLTVRPGQMFRFQFPWNWMELTTLLDRIESAVDSQFFYPGIGSGSRIFREIGRIKSMMNSWITEGKTFTDFITWWYTYKTERPMSADKQFLLKLMAWHKVPVECFLPIPTIQPSTVELIGPVSSVDYRFIYWLELYGKFASNGETYQRQPATLPYTHEGIHRLFFLQKTEIQEQWRTVDPNEVAVDLLAFARADVGVFYASNWRKEEILRGLLHDAAASDQVEKFLHTMFQILEQDHWMRELRQSIERRSDAHRHE